MINGDGNDYGDTPNDLPQPTLTEHRPLVLLLSDITGALHQTANTFSELVHELRVARDPIGASTRARIAETFAEVEEMGKRGREGFGG